MSESGAAVERGGDNEEEDCPLCLEPLPPFWDRDRWVVMACCGKACCKDCEDNRINYLSKAIVEGSYGKAEQQLDSFCGLCRARKPKDEAGKMFLERYKRGQLPLNMHWGLGMMFLKGLEGLEQDIAKGIEILMSGAQEGNPECQFVIGIKYQQGAAGLPKSPAKAERWYLAAAEQGHAPAEFNLAIVMRNEGREPDCLRYLRGSAQKGYDGARQILGVAHYRGELGLQKSTEEAIRVLTPAAERGHAKSMCVMGLAMCYPNKEELPPPACTNPNFTKGVHWLRRAAATGDPAAISSLRNLEKICCFRCVKDAPPDKTFLRCSRCRAAWYCSKDCQVQHWRSEGGHKQFCIKWKVQT